MAIRGSVPRVVVLVGAEEPTYWSLGGEVPDLRSLGGKSGLLS